MAMYPGGPFQAVHALSLGMDVVVGATPAPEIMSVAVPEAITSPRTTFDRSSATGGVFINAEEAMEAPNRIEKIVVRILSRLMVIPFLSLRGNTLEVSCSN